ncbi:MAG: DUF4430 domain-containing protein [Solirubrobacteraceae bacterium]
MSRQLAATAAAIALALVAAGCGLGAGPGTSDVTVDVTQAFGTRPIGHLTAHRVPGSETVIRMLERHFRVGTRYGGGFVQSIDGRAGSSSKLDWFYYVNGVEAPRGAATTAVHKGDRIWWDLHDWSATQSTRAVVGSFPEPFLHGTDGKRLPVTLECAPDVSAACRKVSGELRALRVPFASQLIGAGSGTESLALVVGTWRDLTPEVVAGVVDHGPAASGVYARFTDHGSSLALLDPDGHEVRRLQAGAGLVAATSQGSSPPTWLVTGTDAAGVSAAAAALRPAALRDHFALAVKGSAMLPVPQEAAR